MSQIPRIPNSPPSGGVGLQKVSLVGGIVYRINLMGRRQTCGGVVGGSDHPPTSSSFC